MSRRRTALAAAVLVLATVPAATLGTPLDVQDTGATGTGTDAALGAAAAADAGAKIDAILHPLATVPVITDDATTLTVELDPEAVTATAVNAGDLDAVEARLTPSFGEAETEFVYTAGEAKATESTIWPDRTVTRVNLTLQGSVPPDVDPAPTLHDLTVTYPGGADTQPRAVDVTDAFAENPRFVVLADPQVGDGRAMQDGFEESRQEGSPEPFRDSADKVFGDGTADSRWKAFQRSIAEINLLDPDFVLVAGDLTMGQVAPGEYHVEYEDAYRLVNEIQAPTYLAMGNHDGYVQSGEDGYAFWENYFGPLNYSVDYGDQAHIVSVNTYDWDEMDRMAFSVGASTWGGQVQDDQLRWLEEDVTSYRDENPDGLVITFSHHNPSWRQDDYHNETPSSELAHQAEEYPVTEQITRGFASSATGTGQGWVGENRLETRQALVAADGDGESQGRLIHFAGHTHRDRVARAVDGLSVVETTQKADVLPEGESARDLHYVRPDGTFETHHSQAELRDRLANWSKGPLFVDTTTVSSSTNEYFGWRLVDLEPHQDAAGYDLEGFGYDASQAFLESHANDPGFWNASHASLGLFSTPSFHLNVTETTGGPDAEEASVTVESDLAEDYTAVVPLTLDAGTASVDDGSLVWQRSDGDAQDLGVRVTIPAGGTATASASLAGSS